jgi:hypothetical protein
MSLANLILQVSPGRRAHSVQAAPLPAEAVAAEGAGLLDLHHVEANRYAG